MFAHEHWNNVYQSKKPDEVSWYAVHLERSLALITSAAPDKNARIIDVGAGESTLVDDLIDRQYCKVSVLDISEAALSVTKARLGARAQGVRWYAGDVTEFPLPEAHFDVWHDRAVFHFLTDRAARTAYVDQVRRSVRRGGHVIVATFGPDGPTKCSGLDVVRYHASELHEQFGGSFELVEHTEEEHMTPWGTMQQFVYCYCRLV